MSNRHWLQLALTEGIGPILIQRLIAATGSAEAACDARATDLASIEGIGSVKSRQIFASLRRAADEIDPELERVSAAGARLICHDDDEYPALLRNISDPPPVLFIKGDLQPRDLNAVAIVGSRRCSHYGREQADRFAALLAGAGVTVISGAARGVDSAAHRGALAAENGRTIAVLGCGVDIVYPPENTSLLQQIAQRGAVVSEYPMATPPLKENFPRRNRIVSGMSRGVLVVEADIASGALITARLAGDDHGRPVFAIPGRVDNAMSAGPHELIRDGATLVAKLEHILDALGPLPVDVTQPSLFDSLPRADVDIDINDDQPEPKAKTSAHSLPVTDRQSLILENLGQHPASVDDLIAATALPAEIILQELTMMTLRGIVRRLDGQTFMRRNSDSKISS